MALQILLDGEVEKRVEDILSHVWTGSVEERKIVATYIGNDPFMARRRVAQRRTHLALAWHGKGRDKGTNGYREKGHLGRRGNKTN